MPTWKVRDSPTTTVLIEDGVGQLDPCPPTSRDSEAATLATLNGRRVRSCPTTTLLSAAMLGERSEGFSQSVVPRAI